MRGEEDIWLGDFGLTGQGDKWTVQELGCLLLLSPSGKPSTLTNQVGELGVWINMNMMGAPLRLSLANIFERYTHSIRMDYRSVRLIWQTYMVGRLDFWDKIYLS